MNLARLFSYTRLLEDLLESLRTELKQEREAHKASLQAFNEERQKLIDKIAEKTVIKSVYQQPPAQPQQGQAKTDLDLNNLPFQLPSVTNKQKIADKVKILEYEQIKATLGDKASEEQIREEIRKYYPNNSDCPRD